MSSMLSGHPKPGDANSPAETDLGDPPSDQERPVSIPGRTVLQGSLRPRTERNGHQLPARAFGSPPHQGQPVLRRASQPSAAPNSAISSDSAIHLPATPP